MSWDRLFDSHAPHRHHITASQQCCMQRRPPTRAIGRKEPSDHPCATCADRRRSTVAPTSRATASPRTPQPRHHAKALIEARQRMCGSLVDSKKRSRNALPKSEEQVSIERRFRRGTRRLPCGRTERADAGSRCRVCSGHGVGSMGRAARPCARRTRYLTFTHERSPASRRRP